MALDDIVQDIGRPDVNGTPPKMEAVAKLAREALAAPYLDIECNDNLCSSVQIAGSLEPQEQWVGGIFLNSRWFRASLTAPGARYYSGGPVTVAVYAKSCRLTPFRKYTGPPETAVAKLKAWIEAVS